MNKIAFLLPADVSKFLFGLFFIILTNSPVCAQGLKFVSFTQPSQSVKLQEGNSLSLGEYIFTSDNNPVRATLTAIDTAKNLPSWLLVNEKLLNGISYTTNSEISFNFEATDLSPGEYSAIVTAAALGYNSAILTVYLTVTRGSSGKLIDMKVNFDNAFIQHETTRLMGDEQLTFSRRFTNNKPTELFKLNKIED